MALPKRTGYPIDAADVIAPNPEIDGVVTLRAARCYERRRDFRAARSTPNPFSLEPLPMCAAYHEQLRPAKMGEWVVAAFREKRLCVRAGVRFRA